MKVLIDISGTLIVGKTALPGAADAFNLLQMAKTNGIIDDLRCCSNTTKESEDSIVKTLQYAKFNISKDDIFTSLTSCRSLLYRLEIKNPIYLLPKEVKNSFPFPQQSETDNLVDAIVVGLSPQDFNYELLNRCFRILLNKPSTKLIALHTGRFYKSVDGDNSLGPGPFIKALEFALSNTRGERSGKNATIIVGKPTTTFFKECLLSMKPGRTDNTIVMIGDDIVSDFGEGTIELKMKRILVKTGKYIEGDENRANPKLDAVFNSFSDAVEAIICGNVS